jgi:hypothetical protein
MHHPIEHIQGFTRSHWVPPSSKCLRCIAPAAVIVDEFEYNTQNTIGAEELANISSYQTLSADTIWKSY